MIILTWTGSGVLIYEITRGYHSLVFGYGGQICMYRIIALPMHRFTAIVTSAVKTQPIARRRCNSLDIMNKTLLVSSRVTTFTSGQGWLNCWSANVGLPNLWVRTIEVRYAVELHRQSLDLPITSNSLQFLHKVYHIINKILCRVHVNT